MKTQRESKWRWATIQLHYPPRLILIEGQRQIAYVQFLNDDDNANAELIEAAPELESERDALADVLCDVKVELDELREALMKVTACVAHAKDRTPGMHDTYAEAEQQARAILDKHIIAKLKTP